MAAAKGDIVLGIDFGTSYSSAGALIDGKVELVPDDGDPMIPSVVHVPGRGAPVVGQRAVRHLITDPSSTVSSVKRFLGLAANDEVVRTLGAGVPFRLRIAADHLVVNVSGTDHACEQLAAAILTRLRELGERRFGARIGRAVVTVPAAATPAYIDAVRRAARIAHLEVVRVVPEPIAGALALGLHGDPVSRRLVVCDFGGGTFDVTAVVQEGRRFAPIATGGDALLGGDDLDLAMANAIAGLIYKRAKFDALRDHVRRTGLVQRCEAVKRALSAATEARLTMADAYVERGDLRGLNMRIERAWIEPIWQPLIERAIACVADTMAAARWGAADVDQVVLIGGGSMVPLFRRMMGVLVSPERISTTPLAGVAVAMGATLVAAALQDRTRDIPVLDAPPVLGAPPPRPREDDGIPIELG